MLVLELNFFLISELSFFVVPFSLQSTVLRREGVGMIIINSKMMRKGGLYINYCRKLTHPHHRGEVVVGASLVYRPVVSRCCCRQYFKKLY